MGYLHAAQKVQNQNGPRAVGKETVIDFTVCVCFLTTAPVVRSPGPPALLWFAATTLSDDRIVC